MKMEWKEQYKEKVIDAAAAARMIHSGDRVYVGTCSSIAYDFLRALWDARNRFEDVTVLCGCVLKSCPVFDEKEDNPFRISTYFMGAVERTARSVGLPVSFTSMHLSQIDKWSSDIGKPDVCVFEVSVPDEKGFMSFGPSGICLSRYLKDAASKIVLQVNRQTPYIFGQNNLIHVSEADAIIETDEALPTLGTIEIDPVTRQLSDIVAAEIPDGATIQLGLGTVSTAIGFSLQKKNDLGIHSELFSEPMMTLMQNGNVTNQKKGFLDGKSVFGFSLGSSEMYQFMHQNESIYGAEFPFVNDARIIAQNRSMISINTTMALDFFGQAASDSRGWHQQSGTGGQLDFVKGAQWSQGGKSIIAVTSSFMKNGVRISRIVPYFPIGTAITTPRSEVQYVATEYGIVNLKTLTMSDRVRAMISLAHPEFREELADEAKRHGLL
jgi:4-hydroxybutyrate CoA-transferase